MPFGEDLYNGVGARDSALKYNSADDDVRQKFTGYQKDEETQLDFAEARMYENRHARFTAVDPLLASGKSANPQTFNRFVYVGNSPLMRIDPTGLYWHYKRNEDGNTSFRWFGQGDTVADGYGIYMGSFEYRVGDKWVTLFENGPNTDGTTENDRQGWRWGIDDRVDIPSSCAPSPAGPCFSNQAVQFVGLETFLEVQGGFGVKKLFKEGVTKIGEMFTRAFLKRDTKVLRKSLNLSSKQKKKNLAIMKYDVEGVGSGRAIALSGKKRVPKESVINPPPDTQKLQPSVVDGYLRDTDTEYKLLESLGRKIKNTNSKGTVTIFTEREACTSCVDVSKQFMELFPNIRVKIINGQTREVVK